MIEFKLKTEKLKTEKLKTEKLNTDNTKEYQLMQYTPHIHFQSDETGATLRVSEVKPKLDRFIYTYVERNGKEIPESWKRASKENKDDRKIALNYSMRIVANGKACKPEFPAYSSYFGNMGSADKRECIFYDQGLTLSLSVSGKISEKIIIENDKEKCEYTLIKLIDFVLPAFFMLNCFGTRSTKGWGSYGIKDNEYSEETDDYLLNFVDLLYKTSKFKDGCTWKDKLEIIRLISGMMKGGFNYGGYYKGEIFRYFTQKKETGSDKAFMKQKVIPGFLDVNEKSESRKKYEKFVFSRAFLGLYSSVSFRKGNKTDREGVVLVEDKEKKIQRFNNPVWFVPNGKLILIVPKEIPETMKKKEGKSEKSREFIFYHIESDREGKAKVYKPSESDETIKKINGKYYRVLGEEQSLSVPDDFVMEKFLDYFVGKFKNCGTNKWKNRYKDEDGKPEEENVSLLGTYHMYNKKKERVEEKKGSLYGLNKLSKIEITKVQKAKEVTKIEQ